MKPWTLVMAYYENPGMLRHQLAHLRRLPDDIQANLHYVVVDDGSPTAPAEDVVCERPVLRDYVGSFQVWRMGVDVRWNQDACRNIGVREAPTQWVLLTDMDHVVPEHTWRRLMYGAALNKHCVHRFARLSAPGMTPYKQHPNSWALTQKTYWRVGGYDEALAGNYGTDGDFLVRVRATTALADLAVPLVRYPREVIADASTTTFERKRPEEKEAIKRIIRARGTDWRPLHFSFPCERVL